MVSLLLCFGYNLRQDNGSAVKFINQNSNEELTSINPNGILKKYVLQQVIEKLQKEDLI